MICDPRYVIYELPFAIYNSIHDLQFPIYWLQYTIYYSRFAIRDLRSPTRYCGLRFAIYDLPFAIDDSRISIQDLGFGIYDYVLRYEEEGIKRMNLQLVIKTT